MYRNESRGTAWVAAIAISILALGLIAGAMRILPEYGVWSSQLRGEAELKRAEMNRRVAVEEAIATRDSAEALAEAEIIRARGVAEANEIIGDSLKGNSDYLRYLWVQSVNNGSNQVIYIPTEANLPILEAGRATDAP